MNLSSMYASTVVIESNDTKTRRALPSALVCSYVSLYVYLNPLFLKALIVVEVICIIFQLYELWRYIDRCFNLERRIWTANRFKIYKC